MRKHSLFVLTTMVGGLLAVSLCLFLLTPSDKRTLQTITSQARTEPTSIVPHILTSSQNMPTLATVKHVIDGDTIELASGQKVRYIGMNTPEISKRKIPECFALAAKEKNKELVEGKQVRLEKDVSDKDKYGRLLRFVYVDNLFVNEELVRSGYARVSSYPPDISKQDVFLEAERSARKNNKGLWSGCTAKN